MVLPAMGVVSDAIAAFARKNVFGYKMVAYSSLGIAFVGFFAWGHHMFVSGQSPFDNGAFAVISMLVGVFTAIKVFSWVATLYRGAIAVKTPLIYICGFLFFIVFGGMTGIAVATVSLDVHWHDTYFVVAHFHFIMVGAVIMAFLIALHYWFPKMFGKKYHEGWGMVAAALIVLGFNATFIPQFLLGNAGMPRRYYMYPERFQALNVASTAGASLLAFGFVIILIYLIYALVRGEVAGDNPWDSRGIEWMTTSPPDKHNFHETPVITVDPHSYQNPARRSSMSSSDAHANPHLAHHFDTIEKQDHAVRLGMWLFLATEVLLFAGLFLGYTVYRYFYHEAFHEASRHLDLWAGTTNTIVLITSSLTVALAYFEIKRGNSGRCAALLAFTILCALAFLFIKGIEYHHKFEEGALPGQFYHFAEVTAPGANLYYTIYFLATGLHAFHVIVGMSILIWVLVRVLKGHFSPDYYIPVELGGLYWHLVDLVWIFLFPLLYLI
jgi:heme/copper-type cytochrome/quinol oxidase subunit 3